jgi:threonyl-tRNA synthetase
VPTIFLYLNPLFSVNIMIAIAYKDKKTQIDRPMSAIEIGKLVLSKEEIKGVITAKVDDKPVDLSFIVSKDAALDFIKKEDQEGLEIIRHSTAHLMAEAVKQLFPQAKITIGPNVEDGFYYDFYYPDGFSESDLPKIEAKMREIVKENQKIERKVVSRDEALKFFASIGETYKVQLIEAIPKDEEVTFYKQGDFIDVCRGPHVSSTGKLGAFKLTKLAGAYWRGDSKNEVLQRIYGTAWATKEDLENYLKRIEEAKQRDHRLLGKKMDLFHMQEEAPGMIFWHPNGWNIYKEIKNYLGNKLQKFGYQEIATPMLLDRTLWEKSGHWDKYSEIMFVTESENHLFAIKPMNCPGHIQIFKQGIKSYRDLPIRYAEFGSCHRNEYSGTLHGLFRVRGFVQDDGHILCTENQIAEEAFNYIDQLLSVYRELGFDDVIMRLSTRPESRVGSDEVWDKAEKALEDVLNVKGIKWQLDPGAGAFYGPKIDCHLKDTLGRVWQCGTLQVDFSMPERLGAHYIAEDGSKKPPVMLHRAMLGSIERFIGILLENSAGDLPIWLAPVQAVVMNITDNQISYVNEMAAKLQSYGFRVSADIRNEKIGFKIREHSIERVPYLVVAGDQEVTARELSVRTREGKDLGKFTIENFIVLLQK